ncbi:MAG: ATP synthase F1 subunit epsilon [bacterium]|jgi:F-type H+-transporting ATPase subunit epsilon|nr:ATP synthase F1 subunit epsilon [bacterium]
MSAPTFHVEIVTPAGGVVLSREARHVRLPGETGAFGVLAGHANLMAALGTGLAEVEEAQGGKIRLAISGGYAQVQDGRLLVLAESAELPERVDAARAEAARLRALARLEDAQGGMDKDRARAALLRAINRLSLLNSRS